jgi:acyl-[acyl-carrier-protein]-phospholipid O-acyltransferase / long-chain-fatty-acid--[acyl-carrier-protein] ligase
VIDSRLALLAQRRFAPIFFAQFFGVVANNLFKTAMLILIAFRIFPGDAAASGSFAMLAIGIFALPHFLFASLAGQLADGMDKARLARFIKGVEILLMLAAAVALLLQSLPLLLLVLFASGVRGTFFGPLDLSILPHHLDRKQLLMGAGMLQAGGVVAVLLGQICGGVLPVLWAAAMLPLLSTCGFIASLFIPPAPAEEKVRLDWNLPRGILNVVRPVLRSPALRGAIFGISWFYVLGAVFTSQFAPLVSHGLGAEQAVVSLLLAAFLLGTASGALIVHRLLKGVISARLVPVAALAIGLATLDSWFAIRAFDPAADDAIPVAAFLARFAGLRLLLDMYLIAAAAAVLVVPLFAVLQTAGPGARRTRDIAANNIVNALAVLIATGAVALLIDLGFRTASLFLLLGLLTFAVAEVARRQGLADNKPI